MTSQDAFAAIPHGLVLDLDEVPEQARPTEPKWRLDWCTHHGYRPRRNSTSVARVVWWCRCCDIRLKHSRSAFCDEHRDDYNKQRRRIRDEADLPIRIARTDAAHIADLVHHTRHFFDLLRSYGAQRQAVDSNGPKTRNAAEAKKEASRQHEEALRALFIALDHVLSPAGQSTPLPLDHTRETESDRREREAAATALGKRVRKARARRDLTQQQVAARIGVDRFTYYHFENGTGGLDSSRLPALAQALDVQVGDLFP
ncbi:helix-turn-helix transcriptional regulator [Nocardioides abyssi]|uniref:Helix-turn-helix transcriptional regulator n=1 Tax=Nocardioides abyssi TaxID=3058370 RepID=A0ABT8ESQ0_9ACTN|nr:helix-turn-helix transcriptional regulator [Nocardioides abyssi]MDN4161124.1 helix-turn-helix transcriptional regulator [Nocardioides abyssi]